MPHRPAGWYGPALLQDTTSRRPQPRADRWWWPRATGRSRLRCDRETGVKCRDTSRGGRRWGSHATAVRGAWRPRDSRRLDTARARRRVVRATALRIAPARRASPALLRDARERALRSAEMP